MSPNPGARTFLIYERDGVTCDRLRQLVRAEGGTSCAVDSIELFHELRARLTFDVFAVGVESPEELEELKLRSDIQPLILLIPPSARARSTHYSVALPHALLVDRRLRDPDALRALGGPPAAPAAAAEDPVRRAFAPFGLSERQLEVLRRALLGESGAEIAARLFISELTVRNHLHAIYERVGVGGRRELMGRFLRALLTGA
jgi:DNA-binding CsgD family transcriptional regulator